MVRAAKRFSLTDYRFNTNSEIVWRVMILGVDVTMDIAGAVAAAVVDADAADVVVAAAAVDTVVEVVVVVDAVGTDAVADGAIAVDRWHPLRAETRESASR